MLTLTLLLTAVYDYESPERVLLSDILPGRSLEHMTEPDEPRGLGYPRAPGCFRTILVMKNLLITTLAMMIWASEPSVLFEKSTLANQW